MGAVEKHNDLLYTKCKCLACQTAAKSSYGLSYQIRNSILITWVQEFISPVAVIGHNVILFYFISSHWN
jgi:hypothetical protein